VANIKMVVLQKVMLGVPDGLSAPDSYDFGGLASLG